MTDKPWDKYSATRGAPVIVELVRSRGTKVRWRVKLACSDRSVNVTSDELNNYRYFRNAVADDLGLFLPDLQKGEWASILIDAQSKVSDAPLISVGIVED